MGSVMVRNFYSSGCMVYATDIKTSITVEKIAWLYQKIFVISFWKVGWLTVTFMVAKQMPLGRYLVQLCMYLPYKRWYFLLLPFIYLSFHLFIPSVTTVLRYFIPLYHRHFLAQSLTHPACHTPCLSHPTCNTQYLLHTLPLTHPACPTPSLSHTQPVTHPTCHTPLPLAHPACHTPFSHFVPRFNISQIKSSLSYPPLLGGRFHTLPNLPSHCLPLPHPPTLPHSSPSMERADREGNVC